MKIFGFGKDKSVQKLDKPDTSGLENLGQEKSKAESIGESIQSGNKGQISARTQVELLR